MDQAAAVTLWERARSQAGVVLAVLLVTGCPGCPPSTQDAGPQDGDAAVALDGGGGGGDAGNRDAGAGDAARMDAATPDATAGDAGTVDAATTGDGGVEPPTVVVDPTVLPRVTSVGDWNGVPRNVVAMRGPTGAQADFVVDELVLKAAPSFDVQPLLTRRNGQVMTSIVSPDGLEGTWIIRVDPATGDDTQVLALWMALGGAHVPTPGRNALTSTPAMRLLAILLEEAAQPTVKVMPNVLSYPQSLGTRTTAEGNLASPLNESSDVCMWPYMVRAGVCDAWKWLADEGLLNNQVFVGIVDQGFTITPDTPPESVLLADRLYWGAPFQQPTPQALRCDDDSGCQWHGTWVANAAAGLPDNSWGAAGPGGPVSRLGMLDPYSAGALLAADTVAFMDCFGLAMSTGGIVLASLCHPEHALRAGQLWTQFVQDIFRHPPGGPPPPLGMPQVLNLNMATEVPNPLGLLMLSGLTDTFVRLRNAGFLVVSPAGNGGRDVDDFVPNPAGPHLLMEPSVTIPCELTNVLCVGGLNTNGDGRHNLSNRGDAPGGQRWIGNPAVLMDVDNAYWSVDIYAPFEQLVGPDPGGGALSLTDSRRQVKTGTSLAAPFVAGVAALVWAANPRLTADEVESILLSTMSRSPAGIPGAVDANAAVVETTRRLQGGEFCNGMDDDGDIAVDENPAGDPLTRPCYGGAPWTLGIGLCHAGIETCVNGRWNGVCDAVTPATYGNSPDGRTATERQCDGLDEDCDGTPDDEWDGVPATDVLTCGAFRHLGGHGICVAGTQLCTNAQLTPCVGYVGPQDEIPANGLDDDCDDRTDEPPAPTNVRASRDQPGHIDVTWDAVVGATAYRVFRQETGMPGNFIQMAEVTVTTWRDLDPKTRPVTDYTFMAPASHADRVEARLVINHPWDGRRYHVVAVVGTEVSDPSSVAQGFLSAPSLTNVQIAVESAADADCPTGNECNAGTHVCLGGKCRTLLNAQPTHPEQWIADDTQAGPPVVVPGSAAASDGLAGPTVRLTLTGTAVTPGPTRRYWARGDTELGSTGWLSGDGFRSAQLSDLTVRWERSTVDSDQPPFVPVPLARGYQAVDSFGSVDGSAHYYRAAVSAGSTTVYSNTNRGFGDVRGYVAVEVGSNHACGIETGGTVRCWGNNDQGQASPPTNTFRQLVARELFTCGLTTLGVVVCWGQGFAPGGTLVSPNGELLDSFAAGFSPGATLELCGLRADGSGVCFDRTGAVLPAGQQPAGNWLRLTNIWCGIRTTGAADCFRDYGALSFGVTPATHPGPYLDFYAIPESAPGMQGFVGFEPAAGFSCVGQGLPPPLSDDIAYLSGGAGLYAAASFPSTQWNAGPYHSASAGCRLSAATGAVDCFGGPPFVGVPLTNQAPLCGPYSVLDVGASDTDGSRSACAVRSNGRVDCWGASTQVAAGPDGADFSQPPLHKLRLTSGGYTGAALSDPGTLQVWGQALSVGDFRVGRVPATPSWAVYVDTVPAFPNGTPHLYTLTINSVDVTLLQVDGAASQPKNLTARGLANAINQDPRINTVVRAVVDVSTPDHHLIVEPLVNGTDFTLSTVDTWLDLVPLAPRGGFTQVDTSHGGGLGLDANGRLYTWGWINVWAQAPQETGFTGITCGSSGCCASHPQGDRCFYGTALPVPTCGDGHCSPAEDTGCPQDCTDETTTDEGGDRPGALPPGLPATLTGTHFDLLFAGWGKFCGVMRAGGQLTCWDGNPAIIDVSTFPIGRLPAAAMQDAAQLVENQSTACVRTRAGAVTCASAGATGLLELAGPYDDVALSTNVCVLDRAGGVTCVQFVDAGNPPGTPTGYWPGPYVNVEASNEPSVASGYACFETAAGRLDCTSEHVSTVHPLPHGGVVDVQLDVSDLCFLLANGTMECRHNGYGNNALSAAACNPITSMMTLAEEPRWRCGILASGDAVCEFAGTPSSFPGPWARMSLGAGGMCGVHAAPADIPAGDGALDCVSPLFIPAPPPQLVAPPLGTRYVDVSVGAWDACVVDSGGGLACWGVTAGVQAVPALPPGELWEEVHVAAQAACGRTNRGHLHCWGDAGTVAQLVVPPDAGFRRFAFKGTTLCAINAASQVDCFSGVTGAASWFNTGTGSLPGAGYVAVDMLPGFAVCGVRMDGMVRCAGAWAW